MMARIQMSAEATIISHLVKYCELLRARASMDEAKVVLEEETRFRRRLARLMDNEGSAAPQQEDKPCAA